MGMVTPSIGGAKISNFDVNILQILDAFVDSSAEPTRYAEISLIFEDGSSSKTVRVALSKLSVINWSEIDHRAALDSQIAVARANRYIADNIRRALDGLPVTNVHRLSHSGLGHVLHWRGGHPTSRQCNADVRN